MGLLSQFGGIVRSGRPPGAAAVKEFFWTATDYNANTGASYRVRNIGGAGNHRFSFFAPNDFIALVSVHLLGIANVTNAAAQIDFTSEYAAVGEALNNHTQTVIGQTFNVTLNRVFAISITNLFTNLAANDVAGIFVNHIGIGGALNYLGIRLRYT